MRIELAQQGDTLTTRLSGDWESGLPVPRFERLLEDRAPGHPVRVIDFDASGLGAW
ncbi:MAG: hypothetical protein IH608_07545, partial [Proteobacteria bacterium]|nr:hypothetical protein [Pseudomonadota bacterium]